MSEWRENPHAGVRKIPDDVREWLAKGGAVDVRMEGHEYWNASPIMSFGGKMIVSHYRLVPTAKQEASTNE